MWKVFMKKCLNVIERCKRRLEQEMNIFPALGTEEWTAKRHQISLNQSIMFYQ